MTWKLVPSPFEFTKNQAQTLLENETWHLSTWKVESRLSQEQKEV